MRLTRTFNAGYDNLYLNKDDVDRLLKGQMIKESSLIVQMEKPERQWVGLTDEEMHECWDSPLTPLGMKHARMIEAKLRSKNSV